MRAVEVLAVPLDDTDLPDRVEHAVTRIRALDRKLQDVVAVVRDIDGAPEDVVARAATRRA